MPPGWTLVLLQHLQQIAHLQMQEIRTQELGWRDCQVFQIQITTATSTKNPATVPTLISTVSPVLLRFIVELFPVDSPNVGKTFV